MWLQFPMMNWALSNPLNRNVEQWSVDGNNIGLWMEILYSEFGPSRSRGPKSVNVHMAQTPILSPITLIPLPLESQLMKDKNTQA